MGLVTETPGEPRRFLPNPPEKALRSYLEEQEKKASDLYSFISSLEESCNDEVKGSASEPSRVWVLRGKKMILEKTRQLLSGADKSVQIETDTEGSVMFFELFREQLESLKEKLVKIRLIAPLNPTNRYALCQLEYACEVVESSVPWPIIHLTVDSRHFLLAFMEPSVFIPHLESEIAIYSENPVLARIFEVLLSRRAKWSTS